MCKCSCKALLLSWIPYIWIWVIARFFLDASDQIILGCNSEFRTMDAVLKYNIARIALYMNINFNIRLLYSGRSWAVKSFTKTLVNS